MTKKKITGTIVSLQGQVAQVAFGKDVPAMYEVLTTEDATTRPNNPRPTGKVIVSPVANTFLPRYSWSPPWRTSAYTCRSPADV